MYYRRIAKWLPGGQAGVNTMKGQASVLQEDSEMAARRTGRCEYHERAG